jgi:hypothetical protein
VEVPFLNIHYKFLQQRGFFVPPVFYINFGKD